MRVLLLALWIPLTALNNTALGAEKEGIQFPDSTTVDTQKLVLNGLGVRTATIFKVRVYVAGLYLKQMKSSAQEVLSSSDLKQMKLKFVRDVDVEKMRETWDDSFKNNCESECESGKKYLETLKGYLVSVHKGDEMTYTLRPGSVEISLNGLTKGKVENPAFAQNLLATWLGKKPPSEALKDGLLGKK